MANSAKRIRIEVHQTARDSTLYGVALHGVVWHGAARTHPHTPIHTPIHPEPSHIGHGHGRFGCKCHHYGRSVGVSTVTLTFTHAHSHIVTHIQSHSDSYIILTLPRAPIPAASTGDGAMASTLVRTIDV